MMNSARLLPNFLFSALVSSRDGGRTGVVDGLKLGGFSDGCEKSELSEYSEDDGDNGDMKRRESDSSIFSLAVRN